MTIYTATAILVTSIVTFVLGLVVGRKYFSKQTAIQVIENLKEIININESAHKEKMDDISKKYTDLKDDVLTLIEENKLLKEEIKNIKK